MNLNAILFPAPSYSYNYNKLKGQLIFIPKWKKVPVVFHQKSKINLDNLHKKTFHKQQKSSTTICNSSDDSNVSNIDHVKESNVPKMNITLLSQNVFPTNEKLILSNTGRLINHNKSLANTGNGVNHDKSHHIFHKPRSYASNNMKKLQNFITDKKLDLSTNASRFNRFNSNELNNASTTRRTFDIVNDYNKEKNSNCDESYHVEDQEIEPKSVAFNKNFKFIKSSNTKSL